MLLALIDVILVLASRQRFEALAINIGVKPEESVVLLPQINIAIGAHLFEMCKTEDRIVDLGRVFGYVGHGFCSCWDGRETGTGTGSVKTRDGKSDLLRTVMATGMADGR